MAAPPPATAYAYCLHYSSLTSPGVQLTQLSPRWFRPIPKRQLEENWSQSLRQSQNWQKSKFQTQSQDSSQDFKFKSSQRQSHDEVSNSNFQSQSQTETERKKFHFHSEQATLHWNWRQQQHNHKQKPNWGSFQLPGSPYFLYTSYNKCEVPTRCTWSWQYATPMPTAQKLKEHGHIRARALLVLDGVAPSSKQGSSV